MIIPVCHPYCPLRHLHTTLSTGYQFDSPWMGKGKVVSISGDWCDVYWDSMGIIQTHSVEQIVHEVRLEQKNKERLDKRNRKR